MQPNDDAYANAAHIEGAEAYPPRWAAAAATFRAAAPDLRQITYGAGPREQLDLFLPSDAPAGLAVFVHGGYWLRFDRSTWSHLAQGALARGWAMALPSYNLCPDIRITGITLQIARAIDMAASIVEGPIALAGHSAGGHLVARMLAPGLLDPDVTARLAKVLPISPVADLRPLLETSMNADLHLDEDEAAAESPVLMQDRLDVPVTVWVGSDERPAFLDQARWLAEAWGCSHVIDPGKHHFDVIDGLIRPDSALTRALLA